MRSSMFLNFFYALRAEKVPTGPREYLDFLRVIDYSLSTNDVFDSKRFYNLARASLVKDVTFYDGFDLAFSRCFSGIINFNSEFRNQLETWLNSAMQKDLSLASKEAAQNVLPENLLKELIKRIEEQTERHDGGNYWIGTGGTSAFGHSGYNHAGIRLGGESINNSALAVAGERKFSRYRKDCAIEIRQWKTVLKSLRTLHRSGRPQLDIPSSVRKSCDQGGDVEVVYKASRKNQLKLLLLTDVGGSMTPHSQVVSSLFSAAHQINHFREFHHYYFHNIFYDKVYSNISMKYSEGLKLEVLMNQLDKDTCIIIVGDAAMAPYELFHLTSDKEFFYKHLFYGPDFDLGSVTGWDRLLQLKSVFSKIIWLNPDTDWRSETQIKISSQVSMFPMTLEGLENGIRKLLVKC